MTWKELCLDRRFWDLPFKIELNGQGQIIMSPTHNYHGYFAFRIGELFRKHLPQGEVIVECAVETSDGTKEAAVAWASRRRWAKICDEYSASIAPEICVEVMSLHNRRAELVSKKDLYLKAGAREYWICDKDGRLEFFDASGQLSRSKFAPKFQTQIKKK
ncbi:MAG: Uma2 family endonuclease [Verrucomicrobia bacterium]|nr:Uma2 family endonuclease [Verrucomicrobiota bacterium]